MHSQAGNDKVILKENYDVKGFTDKMKIIKPKYIGFTSKTAASFVRGYQGITSLVSYGLQSYTITTTKYLSSLQLRVAQENIGMSHYGLS